MLDEVLNGLCFKSHSSNVMSLQTPSVVDVIVVGGVIVAGGVIVVVDMVDIVDIVDVAKQP